MIGNSHYTNSRPLSNAINDANGVAEALRDLNFTVIAKADVTFAQFEQYVQAFFDASQYAEIALFYYAGHAVQWNSNNYMIPIDANIRIADEIRLQAVKMNLLLEHMELARSRVNVVILDACRDNPFPTDTIGSFDRYVGLAEVDAPPGTLISYATSPGKTASDGEGNHSPYTAALLKYIKTPDLKIEDVFKLTKGEVRTATRNRQTPWESTSLDGDFYFHPVSVSREVSEFWFDYIFQPTPGRRIWRKINTNTWTEQYPNGVQSIFRVVGRGTIDGDSGTLVRKFSGQAEETLVPNDGSMEVFIPDKSARLMWQRVRHYFDGRWMEWAYLGEMKGVK